MLQQLSAISKRAAFKGAMATALAGLFATPVPVTRSRESRN